MGLFLALSPLLMAAATPAGPQCHAIPGWEQLLANDHMRWIVIGEIHGTNEAPAIFADMVCLTAQARPVVVALEQPSSDQPAIDNFMVSDGGPDAKRTFLRAQMWNMSMKDGRSSEAYFRLFETLRDMLAAGRIKGVVAFQPSHLTERPTPAGYEKAMAQALLASAQPDATVIALVGNAHAMRMEVPWQPAYMAMAGHLPPEATLTLDSRGEGGETWQCSGASGDCGVKSLPKVPTEHPRGVELAADKREAFSGVLYLGVPTTASLPQTASGSAAE